MTGASGITGDGDRERADREATDWLILLQDDPDDAAMRARFDAWLAASAVNAAAWTETRYVSDVIGGTPPAHSGYWAGLPHAVRSATVVPIGAAQDQQQPRSVDRRAGQHKRRNVGVMAAALAACLAIVLAPSLILRMQADYVSGTGEVRTVQLEDGSTVRLAAGSAIDVAYANGERQVNLLKGDAYFEVQRDPDHPFRVAAHDVETTVLGTGFEVRLKDKGASVAVRHGLVRVDYRKSAPPISTRLAAGETFSVAWTGAGERGAIRPEKIAAWTNGQLVVSDRPVSEVIDALRPWYSGVIVATGDRLATERVTGVYDLRDPAGALVALGQAHHARVRRISPWLMMISSH